MSAHEPSRPDQWNSAQPHELQNAPASAQPPRDDRTLITIGLAALVASIVLLGALWWIARSETQVLEEQFGLAREQADQQIGTIEQELETLDDELDELPRGEPGAGGPPAPLPDPLPAPTPDPLPAPTPDPAPPRPAPSEPVPADPQPSTPDAAEPDGGAFG